MANKSYVFKQFLSLLSGYEFQCVVNKYHGDYRTKNSKYWDQMARRVQDNSLRDIEIVLNAHANKLYHIGIKQCPKSTIVDANERHDYRI